MYRVRCIGQGIDTIRHFTLKKNALAYVKAMQAARTTSNVRFGIWFTNLAKREAEATK